MYNVLKIDHARCVRLYFFRLNSFRLNSLSLKKSAKHKQPRINQNIKDVSLHSILCCKKVAFLAPLHICFSQISEHYAMLSR